MPIEHLTIWYVICIHPSPPSGMFKAFKKNTQQLTIHALMNMKVCSIIVFPDVKQVSLISSSKRGDILILVDVN